MTRRLPAPLACALPALAVLAALLARPATAQAQVFEEGIVEVVAERLPSLTLVVLVDEAGAMLLPVAQLASHLGYEVAPGAPAIVLPRLSGGRAELDVANRRLVQGRDTIVLAAAELVVQDNVAYLRADRLAAALEAELTLYAATLTFSVRRAVPFPAQQRIIAEQRRAMVLARQRFLERSEAQDTVPYPAVSGAGVLDWEVATSGLDPLALTSVRTQAGAALLGGDLTGSIRFEGGRTASGGARDASLRYYRFFPHNPYVRQVRVGDIISSGLFARFVRGVELSNQPLMREQELGMVMLDPDLPAGWDYEVFQGNQLLGYSEPGGRDGVAVPLRAGTTPVQVRMFGPAGEEVVTTLLYQTPVSLLRRGAVEYAVAAGRCEGGACERYGHADVRWGATSFITVGAGVEHQADTLHAETRPYAVASFTTGHRWTGELHAMPGALYRSTMSLFVRESSLARLRGSIAEPGFGPLSPGVTRRSRWETEFSWDERIADAGGLLPRQLRFGGAASGTGELERWRASANASVAAGNIELRYENDRIGLHRELVSVRGLAMLPLNLAGRTWRPMLGGGVSGNGSGIHLGDVGATLQPTGSSLLSANVQWTRGFAQPAVTLGWIARIGPVQAAVRGSAGRSGRASSAALLSGSTAITHAGTVSGRPIARTGYAGLHGQVFIDNDGDGVFSPGDEVLPHAAVLAGGVPLVADAQGRYQVWGLQPYAVATVAIDSARIPDPGLATARPALLVRPAPNTARRVDLPLIRTRELLGSLQASAGVATTAGVTVELRNEQTGDVVRATTFADGQFYVSRVRPGRYTASVAASSLQALAARAPEPLSFTVPAAGDDVLVELPAIRLDPAR